MELAKFQASFGDGKNKKELNQMIQQESDPKQKKILGKVNKYFGSVAVNDANTRFSRESLTVSEEDMKALDSFDGTVGNFSDQDFSLQEKSSKKKVNKMISKEFSDAFKRAGRF